MLLNSSSAQGDVCSNLRPASAGGDAVVPVDSSAPIVAGSYRFGLSTATGILAYNASQIICINGSDHYAVAELDGREPLTFVPAGGRVVVVCEGSWLALCMAQGAWTLEGELKSWDSMPHIYATAAEEQSVTIPARPLRKSLASGARMSDADARDISASLTGAYTRIAALTAAAGASLQPRAAGYRIVDGAGHVIFSSPMLVYGTPQLAGSWAVTTDAAQAALEPLTITAAGYRLHLRVPPQPSALLRAMGARIEVVASPQMHTYDDRAPMDVRPAPALQRPVVARALMPGADLGKLSPAAPSAPELAQRLVCDQEEWRVLATIERPFASDDEDATFDIPAEASAPDLDREALRRAWAWRPQRVAAPEAWARSPHRVSARAAAVGSGVTLMAGLTVRPFRGYELPLLAVETLPQKVWRALVTVTFEDGTVISQAAEGTAHAPAKLSPVLSYPAPGAVRMAVQLSVADEPLRVQSFTLRPDMRCRDAVWVASSLASPAWRVSEGAIAVPGDTAQPLAFPGAAAVCAQDQPLAVLSAVQCSEAELRAAVPVARGPQAWDVGRARFLVGGLGGLHCAVVSADRRRVAVTLLDARPVAHRRALTPIADGEAAALAGRDLLRVKASAVSTIATGLEADMVAWDPSHGELWAINSAGETEARVYPLASPGRYFTAPLGQVRDVTSSPVDLYTALPASIARLSYDADYAPDSTLIPIAWSGTLAMPRRQAAQREAVLEVPLAATYFAGTVTVAHAHAPGPEAVIARYAVEGPVLSPLRMLIAAYPARGVTVSVQGTASADASLRAPGISII